MNFAKILDAWDTILMAIIAAFTSAGAWQFYTGFLKARREKAKEDKSEQNMFRNDLIERVAALERKLEEAHREKEEVERELTCVKTELAEYRVRLEFLERENERLKNI